MSREIRMVRALIHIKLSQEKSGKKCATTGCWGKAGANSICAQCEERIIEERGGDVDLGYRVEVVCASCHTIFLAVPFHEVADFVCKSCGQVAAGRR